MSAQYYEGIGRRKQSTARVRMFPGGTGRLTINDRDGSEYLSRAGRLRDRHAAADRDRAGAQLRHLRSRQRRRRHRSARRDPAWVWRARCSSSTPNSRRSFATPNCSRAMPASRNARSRVSSAPAKPRPTPSAKANTRLTRQLSFPGKGVISLPFLFPALRCFQRLREPSTICVQ